MRVMSKISRSSCVVRRRVVTRLVFVTFCLFFFVKLRCFVVKVVGFISF